MRFLHTLSFLLLASAIHSQVADTVQIESILYKGWQNLYSNPDSATWFLEKGKKESERQNYSAGIFRYHNFKAALLTSLGQTQNAVIQYDLAIGIARKYRMEIDRGLTYMKKGTLNQFMGEYAFAAESYLAAAAIMKTNEDKKKIIGLYTNINTTLNNLQQQNQSLQNVLPTLKNNNTSEKEIASILSQKSTNGSLLYFPDQTTLRDLTGGELFVIFGGAKFHINHYDILAKYSTYRSVQKIPDGILSRIPDIPRDGTILKEENQAQVYLIKDGLRHRIESPEVLDYFGGWDALCTLPAGGLEQVPDGGDIVTMQNVLTRFNFKKEYEVLMDSLGVSLQRNKDLLEEVGRKLKAKNRALQYRSTLLWTSLVGIVALLFIGFLLGRNARQKQKIHRQSLLTLKSEEELQRKMALEQERTRIATDMHDDLGAGLTRIKFIAENISEKLKDVSLQPEMEKLKTSSIELVENMGEIIWAMNEKNNTLEDLLFYLRSYSVDYCDENNLTCEFILPSTIPQKIIGGQVRRNIFLVLKESLHNIVKHASAQNVIITAQAGKIFCLTITDDGKGIQRSPNQHGNGLINMEQRAKALKGKLTTTAVDGTVVTFEIPL